MRWNYLLLVAILTLGLVPASGCSDSCVSTATSLWGLSAYVWLADMLRDVVVLVWIGFLFLVGWLISRTVRLIRRLFGRRENG